MSDRQFERAVNDWLEDGSDRTPTRALAGVLLAVRTTPQERDLRIPWRIPMPVYARAAVVAVALVVMVGAGLAFLNNGSSGGIGGAPTPTPTATPAPTASPTASPTPAPSEVAPGITGWTPYTSDVYGFTMSYPTSWSTNAPATRQWKDGDRDLENSWPYADTFASPDGELGLWVWEMPATSPTDLGTTEGVKAWAATFCTVAIASGCDTFTDAAQPMCLDARGDGCKAAIVVPAPDSQYAFVPDWAEAPDMVRVVLIGRPDSFPTAAPYGGSVELLKSILSTMGVTPAP